MNKVSFFLFGNEACNEVQNSEVDVALRYIKESGMSFDVFKFDPAGHTPVDLLMAYDGWFEFMEISELTYLRLLSILKGD